MTSIKAVIQRTVRCCSTSFKNLRRKSIDLKMSANDASVDNSPSQPTIDPELLKKWDLIRSEIKAKISLEDTDIIKKMQHATVVEDLCEPDIYIGGLDISYIKDDSVNACAALVVCSFPYMKVVYQNYQMVKITQPYVPGYLAFKEADIMIDMYNILKQTQPEYLPHVIMVDGNGIHHPNGAGAACHVGVLLDLPCLGVAKNLLYLVSEGIVRDKKHLEQIEKLKHGESFPLVGKSGTLYGKVLKSGKGKIVYVSPGHKISVESATWLVMQCCQYKIPEPIRQADLNSREYIRKNVKAEVS